MAHSDTSEAAVALGAYPAKRCPRATHNRFSPDAPPPPPASPELQDLFSAGDAFEGRVTAELAGLLAGDVLVIEGDWESSSTVDAMHRGVPVIVNGRLPRVASRVGAPDILVRSAGGYLPVDIKNHRALKAVKTGTASVSAAAEPGVRRSAAGLSNRASHWRDDAMQLAHYTRMLQDLGLAANEPIAGIVGTDDLSDLLGHWLGIVWFDLAGRGPRETEPILDRYDREFDLRVRVAVAAREGRELVRPLHTTECAGCAWMDYCRSTVPADDASIAIEAGLLDRAEWSLLYGGGGLTVAQLAGIEPESAGTAFREKSTSRAYDRRLGDVLRRARMTTSGRHLEPLDDDEWPDPPAADVEVDFDIEWDTDGRIYQWGLRVRDGCDERTARYEPVVSFDPMGDQDERDLANRFADHLQALLTEAEQAGRTLSIYHWSNPETSRAGRFPRVAAALDGHTVDLMAWMRKRLFSRAGFSIKKVAPIFGFSWGVDDPGGLVSQTYIDLARAGDNAAREWCLRYNESDVAAQAAIRDGLRRLRASL